MFRRRILPILPLLLFCCLALALVDRPVTTAATAASAGWELCADCHEELAAEFAGTIHARIRGHEYATSERGCEACHGSGAEHAEEGDPAKIRSFGKMSAEEASSACLKCHAGVEMGYWQASEHAVGEVGCTCCHKIHGGSDDELRIKAKQGCKECHADVAAQMNLPSHHPLREGKMDCGDCHNPHGSAVAGNLRAKERPNDLCLTCHASKQGPFIFEHAPVVEDCMICHRPHGSVADNLLTENEPFLCLQCHEFHFHASAVGNDATSVTLLGRANPNPYTTYGWKVAWTKKCTQCHVMVHGSDLPSQAVTGQGKGLTR